MNCLRGVGVCDGFLLLASDLGVMCGAGAG